MPGLLAVWQRVETALVATLGAAALAFACWGAGARYLVPGLAPDWTPEVTVYAVVWAVFLASSGLVHSNGHVRSDMLLLRVGAAWQRRLEAASCLLGIACSLVLLWGGWQIVGDAVAWDERSPSTLRSPLWVYYLALPVGSALTVGAFAIRLVRCLTDRSFRPADPDGAPAARD